MPELSDLETIDVLIVDVSFLPAKLPGPEDLKPRTVWGFDVDKGEWADIPIFAGTPEDPAAGMVHRLESAADKAEAAGLPAKACLALAVQLTNSLNVPVRMRNRAVVELRRLKRRMEQPGSPPKPNGKVRGKNVNARMLESILRLGKSCHGWTAAQWAAELKCSDGMVCRCEAWKQLDAIRRTIAAERATDRRRNRKPMAK